MKLAALVPLALTLCASSAIAQVTTTNLGQAVTDWKLEGDVLAFVVDETGIGDLNGDSDAVDHVVHVRDLATGTTTNLGLAMSISDPHLEVCGGRVIFTVFEFVQGASDLTGDGDWVDLVLHIHDVASGQTINTGLATDLSHFEAGEGLIAVMVREHDQSYTDLNGDGDQLDSVVHAVDPATGAATNVGRSAWPFETPVTGELIAFWVRESEEGVDLNDDGDINDWIQHVHDESSGVTHDLGIAITASDTDAANGYVVFFADESAHGLTDLNGDGDTGDNVLFVFDGATGTVHNSEHAAVGSSFGRAVEIDGDKVAFRVSEQWHFNRDLNGDGDKSDSVVHVMNLPVAEPANLGLASFDLRFEGNVVVSRVGEGAQGSVDLNKDGDLGDRVLIASDLVKGRNVVTGLHVWESDFGYDLWGSQVVARVQEQGQGATDWNGDGDLLDDVLFVFDISDESTVNVGRAVDRFFASGGPQVVLRVPEDEQGSDENGDGDMADTVLEVWDPYTGSLVPLGTAIPSALFPNFEGPPPVVDGPRIVYAVSEAENGVADLNGDLDAVDDVLHLTEHTFGHGLSHDGVAIALAGGGSQGLALDAGSANAGALYWILGTISGISPGIAGPPHVPLNPDAYFSLTIESPTLFIAGALGNLDADGRAVATLTLPPGFAPSLAGLLIHHAAVVLDIPGSGAVLWASNAVPLGLVL